MTQFVKDNVKDARLDGNDVGKINAKLIGNEPKATPEMTPRIKLERELKTAS